MCMHAILGEEGMELKVEKLVINLVWRQVNSGIEGERGRIFQPPYPPKYVQTLLPILEENG